MKYKIGQSAQFSKTITTYDVYGYAGICGDFNELHINQIAAQKTPFKRCISHGLLIASYISTVFGMILPGTGCIYKEQTLFFRYPVYVGDTITAKVEIIGIDETKNDLIFSTIVLNQDGKCVIEGKAVLKAPYKTN